MERALRAATADAAKILAIDDRVGSLAPGKDADIALFDGDPFEYTSHVLGSAGRRAGELPEKQVVSADRFRWDARRHSRSRHAKIRRLRWETVQEVYFESRAKRSGAERRRARTS